MFQYNCLSHLQGSSSPSLAVWFRLAHINRLDFLICKNKTYTYNYVLFVQVRQFLVISMGWMGCYWHGDFRFFILHLIFKTLTTWSRVLPEKQTVGQIVKKFASFYGTRSFITACTSTNHTFWSWARSIQSMSPHPVSWRSILILSSHQHLCLPSGVFSSGLTTKIPYVPLLSLIT
jgi:hypothetical protein